MRRAEAAQDRRNQLANPCLPIQFLGTRIGDRHIALERKSVTTGNLLLSVLDLYDIHQDVQGDSTGRLTKLV